MRFAVAAALTLIASVGQATPRTAESLESRVNRRLDQRLHVTLQKLLDTQFIQSSHAEREALTPPGAYLSRR